MLRVSIERYLFIKLKVKSSSDGWRGAEGQRDCAEALRGFAHNFAHTPPFEVRPQTIVRRSFVIL